MGTMIDVDANGLWEDMSFFVLCLVVLLVYALQHVHL
jgi:hypothetical protein